MTDAELLTKIKHGLGVTGSYMDDTLQVYVDEAKALMLSAGVPQTTIDSATSVGCILRIVADLWNYGSGDTKLSEYTKQRIVQLALGGGRNVSE